MQPLQPDTSYHIFNHANGFENIFRKEDNFYFFLEKYRLYISPIAETYAYCLMPNHFHLVVRIRKREVLEAINFSKVNRFSPKESQIGKDNSQSKSKNFGKVFVDTISDSDLEKYISKQFANLFSSYTQAFNKVYGRMGSLFIKNFKREPITDKVHFLNAVVYTHRNPVHHRFCKHFDEWPYSSYLDVINGDHSKIETVRLLKMTGGLNGFLRIHQAALEKIDAANYPDIPFMI